MSHPRQSVNKRDAKGECLPAASLPTAKRVSSGECVGKSRYLDREGSGDSLCGEHINHWLADAEIGEGSLCGHVVVLSEFGDAVFRGIVAGTHGTVWRDCRQAISIAAKSLCGCMDICVRSFGTVFQDPG